MNNPKRTYSRKILAIMIALYLLNYFFQGYISQLFHLDSQSILQKLEFWRLFTYPLAFGSIESFLLLIATFYIFAPMIENKIRPMIFGVITFSLIVAFGIIHTLIFWDNAIILKGAECISIAILSLYTLFEPKKKIKIYLLPPFPLIVATSLIALLWFIAKYFGSYSNLSYLVQSSLSLTFGVTSALMVFIHLVTFRKIFSRGEKELLKEFTKIDETRKYAMMREGMYERYKLNDEFDNLDNFEEVDYSESRLNEILDKIIEQGKDSLTYEEMLFLENYSRHLK